MNITLKNICKSYGTLSVFENLNITFEDSRISCILGQSGSGKTTLLNIISNLTDYDGTVTRDNSNISYIFQKERLINNLTVWQNLEYVLFSVIEDREERKEKIRSILDIVELSQKKDNYPYELSGGQQQRLSMARAFVFPSGLLLMDEPFRSLDIPLKDRMIKEFFKLWNKDKRTVIFVTHDIDEALMLSNKIYVLKNNYPSVIDRVFDLPDTKGDLTDSRMIDLRKEIYGIIR